MKEDIPSRSSYRKRHVKRCLHGAAPSQPLRTVLSSSQPDTTFNEAPSHLYTITSPFHDLQGDLIPQEKVLGNGRSAVVILQDGKTVKFPLNALRGCEYEAMINRETLNHERSVYHRFLDGDGEGSDCVVRCLELLPEETHLEHMVNRDLRGYLETHRPSKTLQLGWFRQMTSALVFILERRVLVADIASRNFVVGADLALKICDFSGASIIPLDSDMNTVDGDGCTVRIDVGLLAGVMYEIITGTGAAIFICAKVVLEYSWRCYLSRHQLIRR
ncbi:uncharacterized protein BDV14DRAFT_203158 [Aspergillus stella-maris]|uniref:uncharacterized protein n=1 Tax=Aspergillus stella-maris TaxID=1810926 RepID=UPI003CCE237F